MEEIWCHYMSKKSKGQNTMCILSVIILLRVIWLIVVILIFLHQHYKRI